MHRDAEVFPRFGLGVRGDDNVNNFWKLVRSVVRVGGEQDDDGAVRLGLKADDLVKTTGISNDECALVVEALNEFVARRPLTVT